MERRLVTIVCADVAGYSRLIGLDEEGTIARLKTQRRALIEPTIARHGGRIVKTMGDGLLVEFASPVEAVRCAAEIQLAMAVRESDIPENRRIHFRIGINLGDVLVDEGDVLGNGVNIAARLQSLAEVGGICISRSVRDQVRDRLPVTFEDLGEQSVRNIARPVRCYRVRFDAYTRQERPLRRQAGGAGLCLPRWPLASLCSAGPASCWSRIETRPGRPVRLSPLPGPRPPMASSARHALPRACPSLCSRLPT
jgi:adenylate cyclase